MINLILRNVCGVNKNLFLIISLRDIIHVPT